MPYKVIPYTIDNLKECFLDASIGVEQLISDKQHLVCLENYFNDIETKTIVVENKYINREFLEDYASYYVRSFKHYNRFCTRLHFFHNVFSKDYFKKVLHNDDTGVRLKEVADNYQGYMVLKPLPKTIIGMTCLRTYPSEEGRFYPSIRNYKANLFGINLKVDSLAYQEQDSIVAACASSAIWSALHGTGILFQHSLPSPVSITHSAIKHFPFSNRHFPNKGLTPEQMAMSIREVGLVPYLYSAEKHDKLKATLYSYLKGTIPVILVYAVWDCSTNSKKKPAIFKGRHAVTITGYSLNGPISDKFDNINDFSLTSSRINKIYVHDDQIGPFAKMEFKKKYIQVNVENQVEGIDTTARDKNNTDDKIKALPEMLVIPLYHKIRIPFELILKVVSQLTDILNLINREPKLPSFKLFEWDIFLSNVSDFKNEIISDTSIIDNDYKESILVDNYPKYIWRAIGIRNGVNEIEFLFDATDIDQGSNLKRLVVYDQNSLVQLKLLLQYVNLKSSKDMNLIDFIKTILNFNGFN